MTISLEDFKLIKKLGDGATGTVWLAEKNNGIDEGKVYAVKIFEKASILRSDQVTKSLLFERKVLIRYSELEILIKNYIFQILEVAAEFKFFVTMTYAFQSKDYLYLVMDFAQGGEMFSILKERRSLSIGQTRFYIAEIILALEQLHKVR
jgi:serine/threonine protein kinase